MSDIEDGDNVDAENGSHHGDEDFPTDDDIGYRYYDDFDGENSDVCLESEYKEENNEQSDEDNISEHMKCLFNSLRCQKNEVKYLDFKIKILINEVPELVPVHRCVVSAYCPYIKSYLDNNILKGEDEVSDLTHLDGESMLEIINWMYSGKCNFTEENVQDILVSGDFLCIDEVVKLSVDFLCDNLSFKNCSEIYNLSHSYSVFDFQKRVYNYIITNFYSLFTQHYLDDLSVQDIISFTSDDKLMLSPNKFTELNQSGNEFKLLEIVKDYLERKNKYNFWPEFLTKSIRLGFLTESQIDKIIKDDNWLDNSKEKEKCLNLLNDVKSKKNINSKNVLFSVWKTPRNDIRVFRYLWSHTIANDGYLPSKYFNDLKKQLAKRETKNALVIIRGIKLWLRLWDDALIIGGIGITYNDGTFETHGLTEIQPEGTAEFKLEDGEYINQIDYRDGGAIDRLTFHTNLGKKYGPYGGNGGTAGTFKPKKSGGYFAAILGESALKNNILAVRNVKFCWGYIDYNLELFKNEIDEKSFTVPVLSD